jgi:hypothetical protein
MHAGFSQFAAFDQDAIDNKAFLARGKLTMPVLAVGGEKSFGPTMAVVMRRRDGCAGTGHLGFRALADGGAADGDGRSRARFPRWATLTIVSRYHRLTAPALVLLAA